MIRVLVVGGTGFIGDAFCQFAKARGYAVSSLSLRRPTIALDDVDYLIGNLAEQQSLAEVLAGRQFEYVVNCGGYIDHRSYFSGGGDLIRSHLDGVRNLANVLDRSCLKRFVQIGSSDEYGDAPAPQSESLREAPISAYSLAKVAATHFLQMLWRTEQFSSVTLRLFLAYGPGQNEHRFLPQIIRGCIEDRCFPVSYGEQLRDFCYIDDVVRGIMLALDAQKARGRVINLASGTPVTIRAMIEQVQSMVGCGQPEYGKLAYRTGENIALWANASLARELLGWTPKVTLSEGLTKTIDYYRSKMGASSTAAR